MTANWRMPIRRQTEAGETRRVGVEIEMQGLGVDDIARITAETLDGDAERLSAAEYEVEVPESGTWRVEVDAARFKQFARDAEDADGPAERAVAELGIDLVGNASAVVVPCEIVSPPIPLDRLAEPMDALVGALRRAGAKGTRHSLLYAFGVHLNVELPDLTAQTITRYLKSFICLYDWIVDEDKVDLTRQISPFIDPYSREYELLVTDPDYQPSMEQLIDDYLEHNPTRDRALDMLPLFAHIDEERVRRVVDDPLIKARPTFHYRLANSCIDEPWWSIAAPWHCWMQIEDLAAQPECLAECGRRFAELRPRVLRSINNDWVAYMREWLADGATTKQRCEA